jgi:hypothetical protein
MAEQQLLSHESSFDRLAEADVIRDQQVDTRHLQTTHERVELVVLDRDPLRNGAWIACTSALVAAPHRTASKKDSTLRARRIQ